MIACEFSGRVRDAFIQLGHDAISCDLLESLTPGPHIVGDIRDVDLSVYDLLIAHPPCTYLASSGLHWNGRIPGRQQLTEEALDFVVYLLNAPVERIALENPQGCISTRIEKPTQVIHPWQFGDPDSKRTCLWLWGVPQLIPIPDAKPVYTWSGLNIGKENPDRGLMRSVTYPGIARAMAEQWGALGA